jgi:hypothetical protein
LRENVNWLAVAKSSQHLGCHVHGGSNLFLPVMIEGEASADKADGLQGADPK